MLFLLGAILIIGSISVFLFLTKELDEKSSFYLPIETNGEDKEKAKRLTKELIGYAKERIYIFSGSINADIHSFNSLKEARKRGVEVQVITTKEAIKGLKENRMKNKECFDDLKYLKKDLVYDNQHFILVDGKYFRLESLHKEEEAKDSIIDALYIYNNKKISYNLETKFEEFQQTAKRVV